MTFFLIAWRDKRKTKSKQRASSQTAFSSLSSLSSSSPQDSGFGSSSASTVSDHSNAFRTLSSLSSLSPRQHQQQQQQHQRGRGESRSRSAWSSDNKHSSGHLIDSRNESSISTLESKQFPYFTYPSSSSSSFGPPQAPVSPFPAHHERPSTPPLMSHTAPSSSARFKAALSRLLLLPRKGDQHYYPQCKAATGTKRMSSPISSLDVNLDDNRLNGIKQHPFQQQQQYQYQQQQQKHKQHMFHRKHPLLTIKTTTTAPPSILSPLSPLSPFVSNAVLPIPADPTAPACFPGTGPAEFALKNQQLQQLQSSSRRPSLTPSLTSSLTSRRPSLTPSLTSSLTRGNSSAGSTAAAGIVGGAAAAASGAMQSAGAGGRTRHLIPHHHHHLHLNACVPPTHGHDSLASSSGLPSALMLRRGSVESVSMSLHSMNNSPSPLWSNSYDYSLTTVSSNRSMDEMEVVVSSSRKGDIGACHPFHLPHTTNNRYEHGEFDNEEETNEAQISEISANDNNDRTEPRSVLTQTTPTTTMPSPSTAMHKSNGGSPPSLSPSTMAHFSQIEKVTTSVSPAKTKSSLGRGYDISTMFQVGPLPILISSSSPIA